MNRKTTDRDPAPAVERGPGEGPAGAEDKMNPHLRMRLTVLVALMAVSAVAAIAACWRFPVSAAFWFWLAACFAGELLWVRLPFGRATLSMASCFNYAALLVLGRGEAMVATALATVVAELLFMRKPFERALYNGAHTVFAVGAASWAFSALSGGSRDLVAMVSEVRLLPFVAAAVAYYAVNRSAVSLAVAWHEALPLFAAWRRNFGHRYELLSSGAVFSLGAMLATHQAAMGIGGTLLVVLPLLIACDGYRRFLAGQAPDEEDSSDSRRAA